MLSILTVAAFVLPLGLDTFALATALGAAGLPGRERLRASLILTGFEASMPVVGFLVGSGIGLAVGKVSDYVAAAVLEAAGIYLLWPWRDEEEEEERVLLLQRVRGFAVVGLGIGISLDELAVGFGVGLLRLPLLILVALIAAQAFVAAQIGMRLGSNLSEEAREWAERIAGLLLVAAGALVVVELVVA